MLFAISRRWSFLPEYVPDGVPHLYVVPDRSDYDYLSDPLSHFEHILILSHFRRSSGSLAAPSVFSGIFCVSPKVIVSNDDLSLSKKR